MKPPSVRLNKAAAVLHVPPKQLLKLIRTGKVVAKDAALYRSRPGCRWPCNYFLTSEEVRRVKAEVGES